MLKSSKDKVYLTVVYIIFPTTPTQLSRHQSILLVDAIQHVDVTQHRRSLLIPLRLFCESESPILT